VSPAFAFPSLASATRRQQTTKRESGSMRHRWLLILLLTASVTGCNNVTKVDTTPQPKVSGETVIFPAGSPQLASLVLEPVIERQALPSNLNGKLTWNEDKTVRIYTPFAGRVARILVQPGDRVKQGQTLAIIASPDFGQAQSEARRARSDYSLAQQNLTRIKDLNEHGVVAGKDLYAAEADYARAQAEMQRTQLRLQSYGGGSEIDQTYALRSPIPGVVVEKSINPGQELRPDQAGNAPALFVITDPSSLWAVLDASEKDLAQLTLGKRIAIRTPSYRGEDFIARIASISDFLDPATRTLKVRATLDNSHRKFKGEMFVTAEIPQDGPAQLQIPAKAMFFQGGKNFVFVEQEAGSFTRQQVSPGDASDGNIAILAGLQPGQKVVADGALLLQLMLQPARVVK
jgi:cobalt-zinc-cadmium efflux system membrane fusion protein